MSNPEMEQAPAEAREDARPLTWRADELGFQQTVPQIDRSLPPIVGSWFLYALSGLVVVALIISILGHYDEVVVAPGQLVPEGRVKVLQAPRGGVLEAILVEEGAQVEAGEELLRLATDKLESARRATGERLAAAELRQRQLLGATAVLAQALQEVGEDPAQPGSPGAVGDDTAADLLSQLEAAAFRLRDAHWEAEERLPRETERMTALIEAQVVRARQLADAVASHEEHADIRQQRREARRKASELELKAAEADLLEKSERVTQRKKAAEHAKTMADREGQAVEAGLGTEEAAEEARQKWDAATAELRIAEAAQRAQQARYKLLIQEHPAALAALVLEGQGDELEGDRLRAEAAEAAAKVDQLKKELELLQAEIGRKVTRAEFELEAAKAALERGLESLRAKEEQARVELARARADLESLDLDIERSVLVAPVAGTVSGVLGHNPGEVVESGAPLVRIAPRGVPLVMEALVLNRDVSRLEVGQECRLKLDAYPFEQYGLFDGRIAQLSGSATLDPEMGAVYLVTVEVDPPPAGIELFPGLTGQVEIITRRRRIITVVLDPLRRLGR